MARSVVVMVVVLGCSSTTEIPPDTFVPAGFCQHYICFDHTVWKLPPTPLDAMAFCSEPNFIGVEELATCADGCRTNQVHQTPELCAPPPIAPFACDPPATCNPGETFACEENIGCDYVMTDAAFGSCTCDGTGTWACEEVCSEGLCGAAAVQQAMVGTWRGSVTLFTAYAATLEIAADGAWRMYDVTAGGEAFGGGGMPGSNLYIRAQTAAGGAGVIRVFEAFDTKPIMDVHVTGDRLQFKIPWNTATCDSWATFDLQRI